MRITQHNNTLRITRQKGDPTKILSYLEGELRAAGYSCHVTGSGETRLRKLRYIKLTFRSDVHALTAHQLLFRNYGTN